MLKKQPIHEPTSCSIPLKFSCPGLELITIIVSTKLLKSLDILHNIWMSGSYPKSLDNPGKSGWLVSMCTELQCLLCSLLSLCSLADSEKESLWLFDDAMIKLTAQQRFVSHCTTCKAWPLTRGCGMRLRGGARKHYIVKFCTRKQL